MTIGVKDADGRPEAVGLDPAEFDTWSRFDQVAPTLGEYVQPSVTFDVEPFAFEGKQLVLLHVKQFDDIPILCAREAHDERQRQILRRGALYVRSRRSLETAEVPTQEEMREIIDLAVEKGMRRLLGLAHAAGFQPPAPSRTNEELFDAELGELE